MKGKNEKNSRDINNPHDTFFIENMRRKETAADIIKNYLPKNIVKQMDMKTLQPAHEKFTDKEFKKHYSDVIYTVDISGHMSYIYILFEHKSYQDRFVSLQILRNMVKIWENHIKRVKGIKKLPFIFPVLFYQGKKGWKFGNNFCNIIDTDGIPEAERYIPDFMYQVFDLPNMPDYQITGDITTQVFMLTMKHIFREDFPDRVKDIVRLFHYLKDPNNLRDFIEISLRYMSYGYDKESEERQEEINKKIGEVIKEGANMSTVIDNWIEEGKEEGKEEGIKKGKEEGIKKGKEEGIRKEKIETAEKMLSEEFSWDTITRITGISEPEYKKLKDTLNT